MALEDFTELLKRACVVSLSRRSRRGKEALRSVDVLLSEFPGAIAKSQVHKFSQRRRQCVASNVMTPNSLPIHILFLQQRKFTPHPSLRIACHLPTCVSGCPGISHQNVIALPLRGNANEHVMGTLRCAAAETADVAGCGEGEDRGDEWEE
jgi:hypothetical protein